ncbi:MAG: adenine phosphoribosyltransferase, partial [Ruminiclostridium sp.]|nr:adenine phosphoribosyltransferase [Ruminiclostridium sp.]
KGTKVYMQDVLEIEVQSITTKSVQRLFLDGNDAALMKGKRILLVDDVISTGESLHALEQLVVKAGGIVCGRMAILAEGKAKDREDILFLEPLPIFKADGTPV